MISIWLLIKIVHNVQNVGCVVNLTILKGRTAVNAHFVRLILERMDKQFAKIALNATMKIISTVSNAQIAMNASMLQTVRHLWA